MPIATYQKKVFNVSSGNKYILDGLAWSSALSAESQDKLNSKPSTYIKGEELSPLSFTIPLLSALGHDVRKEIESWETILTKKIPDFFILGAKPLGKNKFLLKSVGISDTEVDGKGNLRKATLKIDLEEYVRAGKAEVKKSKEKASAGTQNLYLKPDQSVYDSPNKAEVKRENPNFNASNSKVFSNALGWRDNLANRN